MITLYKQIETKGLYYKEMWYENADKVLIEHSGKVGYVGTIAKTSMTEKEAAIRLQDFSNVCASEGYTKLSENQLSGTEYPLAKSFTLGLSVNL